MLLLLFVTVGVTRGGCGPPVDSMGTDSRGVSGRVDVSFIVTHGACSWATASVIHARASNTAADKCIAVYELEKGKVVMVIRKTGGVDPSRSERASDR